MSPRKPRPSPRPSPRPTVRPRELSVAPSTYVALLAVIVVAGTLVRVVAAQGELWLDEIWSYRTGQGVSALGVFTDLHSDNNHYLNTLYLRLIPEGTSAWWIYRLPALILGSASIVLAALIARRRSVAAAIGAATMTASSFLLVVYSSEARGYVIAVFFAFAAVLAIERFFERGQRWWALMASAFATLGLLGHLTFLHALAGMVAWAIARSRRLHRGGMLIDVALLFALPATTVAVLYWLDLRHLQLGGGPLVPASETAANALAIAVGGYDIGSWKVVATLAALVAAIASVAAVRRSGSDLWILFLVTVLLAPLATVMVVGTGVIYERYLLVALAFMLLSFAWLFDRIAIRSLGAAVALLSVFVLANAVRTWSFIETGRSHYLAALGYITAQSPDGIITIGADHDFRNGRMIDFYRTFVPGGDRILFEERGRWRAGGPAWLFVHKIEPVFEPKREIMAEGLYPYRLDRFYPYAGLSGWHLALYRRASSMAQSQ